MTNPKSRTLTKNAKWKQLSFVIRSNIVSLQEISRKRHNSKIPSQLPIVIMSWWNLSRLLNFPEKLSDWKELICILFPKNETTIVSVSEFLHVMFFCWIKVDQLFFLFVQELPCSIGLNMGQNVLNYFIQKRGG